MVKTMRSRLKTLTKDALEKFDVRVVKCGKISHLEKISRGGNIMTMLLGCPESDAARPGDWEKHLFSALRRSRSQLGQDMFALSHLGFKQHGYFVEFGAMNGIDFSNSYVLEKDFGWMGIVAEPAKRWQKELAGNRKCHVETNCVWRESDAVLPFNETEEAELATIESYSASDLHSPNREKGTKYSVRTISLIDLLDKYRAPREIDYLSIDTEGSEYEILSNFDFDKYKFQVITCEHNFTPRREKIFSLLTANGYLRKFEEISWMDDWYVRAD